MKRYIQENQDRFFEELFSLLRIPSVSAQEARKPDMLRCAERLKELLLEAGADEADVYPVRGHNPVVFAKKMVNPEWKTVLVYGHYDVQPAEPLEKWASDPFAPEIRKDPSGRDAIYARGANDDKGQLFMHLKAFEYLVRSGKLHHNLKFVFEGEEEIGSPSLAGWVRKHKDRLGADVILVSDTTMISEKVPSINCGMRGLAYLEVNLIGPDKDLHSGHYGGAVGNPIQTLCDLISGLIDADGRVTVPGFYDDVVELSIEDRAQLARAPFDMQEFQDSIGIRAVRGEKGYSTLERIGIRPCLDVCGIWGGYTGEGAKTVLPSSAHAKISMRLVPDQESAKITKLFKEYLERTAPDYCSIEVKPCEGGEGFLIPISSPAFQAASRAMEEVYGIAPVPSRGGGSIAVLADMQKILGIDPLLMGFGLERDTIHSPNESFLLSQFFAGMESIAKFYEYFR
ncbi:MAG: dipeptidase [Candidatus Cryptobacteroides sp.]|jgi:acetylornithine deacetylase/succinyl-diaminopimelate desuccinylase-like protein